MTQRKFVLPTALAAVLLLLGGCGQGGSQDVGPKPERPSPPAAAEPAPPPSAPSSPAAADPVDAWLGKWIGPEGTLLVLSKDGGKIGVMIQSLDGPATYVGKAVGDHIEFERGGKTETIRATGGKDTGMKWLLDKHDCLTIQVGEGFCRD